MNKDKQTNNVEKSTAVAGQNERLVIRRVVCAANRYGELLVCGARHHDKVMNAQIRAIGKERCKPSEGYQGFIDQFGCFMTRQEAMKVAVESGQQLDMRRNSGNGRDLYSEGLY